MIRLQTGYVYHYAFVMLIGVAALVTWYLYRDGSGDDMGDWPLLSLVTFLPLAGVALILVLRGEPEVVARNAAAWRSGPSLLTFVLSLAGLEQFRSARRPVSSWSRRRPWLAGLGISYYLGVDGISLWFVLLSALLTLVVRDRLLALGPYPGQGVHDRISGHGHADDRRVRARSTPSCSTCSSRRS